MANTSKRGFASMEDEKQRIIASKGGRAAHAKGTAHEWSSDEARAAGRKGGESRGTRGRTDTAGTPARTLEYSYPEHNLTETFLTNAGRSLRVPGAYMAPSSNGQPALSNTSKLGLNGPAAYSTRSTQSIPAGNLNAEPQAAKR